MESKTGMTYVCPHCAHRMQTAIARPEQWAMARNPDWRHRCNRCGRFAVPEELAAPGQSLTRCDYYTFAGCINAWHCQLLENYDADCERGQIMPKCLYGIFEALDTSQKKSV